MSADQPEPLEQPMDGGEALWPAHASEKRPWSSTGRLGSREDRMFRQVEVSLPPMIAELSWQPPQTIASEIANATREITALDTDPRPYLGALGALLVRTESVASSKIEHIDASMDDYARAQAGVKSNSSASAMVAATQAFRLVLASVDDQGSIDLEVLLAAHRMLMADDVFERSHAGKLREVQNWIGGSDYSPRGAVHIPPPSESVPSYMNDLLRFCSRTDLNPFVQAAITHAQFESIHPFTDGNGRIGRILINALFRSRGLTTTVVIPVASALLAQQQRYFDAVNDYRNGNVLGFTELLVRGAGIAATAARESADVFAQLTGEWSERVRLRAGRAAASLLPLLVSNPVVTVADVERLVGAVPSSAGAAIARLEAAEILRPVTNRTRNQVWVAADVVAELDELNSRIAKLASQAAQ